MELAFSLLAIVLAGAVTAVGKKYKWEAEAAKVNQCLEIGVGFAEQMAIKAAKVEGTPTTGAARLETAVQKIQEVSKEIGLKEKTAEWWATRIEAKLGKKKMDSTPMVSGATMAPEPTPESATTPSK
jgi:hypothetical protein